MPIGAVVGAGVLGAGATVAAGKSNAKAISKSTDSQLLANRESIAAQKEALDKQLAASKEALDKGLAYQTGALNANNALQSSVYNSSGQLNADLANQRIGILNPWAQGGFAAFNQLNSMLGLPEQAAYTPEKLRFTPVTAPTVEIPVTPTPAATPAGALSGQIYNPNNLNEHDIAHLLKTNPSKLMMPAA